MRVEEPAPAADAVAGGNAASAVGVPHARPEGTRAPGHPEPRRRASLRLALRLGFRDTYDYLGSVLVLSMLWCLIGAAGLLGGQSVGAALARGLSLQPWLALPAALVGMAVVVGPLVAGMFRFGRSAAARAEPELFELAWGFTHAPGRAVALSTVQWGGAALLAVNAGFYLALRHLLALALGTLFLYTLGFWLLMCCYQWALVVEQDLGLRATLRKSALLVLDNFGYTLGLTLVLALLSALLWLLVLPGVLLWAGAVTLILTQAVRELLRKYELLPPDPTLDPAADETTQFSRFG